MTHAFTFCNVFQSLCFLNKTEFIVLLYLREFPQAILTEIERNCHVSHATAVAARRKVLQFMKDHPEALDPDPQPQEAPPPSLDSKPESPVAEIKRMISKPSPEPAVISNAHAGFKTENLKTPNALRPPAATEKIDPYIENQKEAKLSTAEVDDDHSYYFHIKAWAVARRNFAMGYMRYVVHVCRERRKKTGLAQGKCFGKMVNNLFIALGVKQDPNADPEEIAQVRAALAHL